MRGRTRHRLRSAKDVTTFAFPAREGAQHGKISVHPPGYGKQVPEPFFVASAAGACISDVDGNESMSVVESMTHG